MEREKMEGKILLAGVVVWCNTHDCACDNVGNGNILSPSDGDPERTEEGYYGFDTSEYCCPVEECDQDWDVYGIPA